MQRKNRRHKNIVKHAALFCVILDEVHIYLTQQHFYNLFTKQLQVLKLKLKQTGWQGYSDSLYRNHNLDGYFFFFFIIQINEN